MADLTALSQLFPYGGKDKLLPLHGGPVTALHLAALSCQPDLWAYVFRLVGSKHLYSAAGLFAAAVPAPEPLEQCRNFLAMVMTLCADAAHTASHMRPEAASPSIRLLAHMAQEALLASNWGAAYKLLTKGPDMVADPDTLCLAGLVCKLAEAGVEDLYSFGPILKLVREACIYIRGADGWPAIWVCLTPLL